MATSGNSILKLSNKAEYEALSDESKMLLPNPPKEEGWKVMPICCYQGAWLPADAFSAYLTFRDHFQSWEDDVILATAPKSGTTWLKALAFAVVHRARYSDFSTHPLLTTNSHDLVKTFEIVLYAGGQIPDLDGLSSPRLFGTHLPFPWLPRTTKFKIVFLCRNPGDNFISLWKMMNKLASTADSGIQLSLEETFELFCDGRSPYGPYWETVLGYWEASKEEPERVLFLKYEELREDPSHHVKRLAQFLGVTFTEEEEREGMVEEVIKLCSFEVLSNLEANKTGRLQNGFPCQSFFGGGRTGDWRTYLTPQMVERLNRVTNEKMKGCGLDLTLTS